MSPAIDELVRLGYQARREGGLQEAKQIFSQSVELARKEGAPSSLASALAGLGQIERDLKNSEAAMHHYNEAVDLLRSSRADPQRLAHTIRHLADVLRGTGSTETARPLYEEALKLYREDAKTTPLDLANAIRGFALLRGAAGENEEARLLWQKARTLYKDANVHAGVQESETQIDRLTNKEAK